MAKLEDGREVLAEVRGELTVEILGIFRLLWCILGLMIVRSKSLAN